MSDLPTTLVNITTPKEGAVFIHLPFWDGRFSMHVEVLPRRPGVPITTAKSSFASRLSCFGVLGVTKWDVVHLELEEWFVWPGRQAWSEANVQSV